MRPARRRVREAQPRPRRSLAQRSGPAGAPQRPAGSTRANTSGRVRRNRPARHHVTSNLHVGNDCETTHSLRSRDAHEAIVAVCRPRRVMLAGCGAAGVVDRRGSALGGHRRRLEHRLPDHRGGRRGVPEGQPGRRASPSASPAPAAASRSSAAARPTSPTRRGRSSRPRSRPAQGRRRVHRAADRLRRPRGRGEPEEHLGRHASPSASSRRSGSPRPRARSRGGRRCAPAGPTGSSTSSAPASTRAPTTTSPRRSSARRARAAATTRRARTTTCWSRASPATSSRSASSASPTTPRTRRKLKLVADRRRQGRQRRRRRSRRASRRSRTAPTSRCRARLHLRLDARRSTGPRSRSFVDFYLDAGRRAWPRRSATSPLGDRGYQLVARSASRPREDRLDVRARRLAGGRRPSSSCSAARDASRAPRDVDAPACRDALIESGCCSCCAAARRSVTTVGIVVGARRSRRSAFFREVSLLGVPHRHRVDAALRDPALRHLPLVARHAAHLGASRWSWRCRSGCWRHLPERVRARPRAPRGQADARDPRRRADGRLRLLRAHLRHAAPAAVAARA